MTVHRKIDSRPECCGKPMAIRATSPAGRPRFQCTTCVGPLTTNSRFSPNIPGYDAKQVLVRHTRLKDKIKAGQRKFVITSAQNNTRPNIKFLKSLIGYCKDNDAELIIIPVHYKNISAINANKEYQKKWADEVLPYLIDRKLYLGGNLVVQADLRISATTLNPLTGKEPINGKKWTVFGHPQFAMETVASPINNLPKRMYTTASVTIANYSQSNLGARAKFHHVTGALVVEVAKGYCFVRQINADKDNSFYDLDYYYRPTRARTKAPPIVALTPGDEHVKFNKKSVRKATYEGPDSMAAVLKPQHIIRHDVLDGYAGSHHHEKDDVQQFRKFHKHDNDYRKEMDQVVDFINETTPKGAHNVIVASNHHDHLTQWLSRVDPREDPLNALFIHEMKTAQYENVLANKSSDPLQIYLTPRLLHKITFLNRKSKFVLLGVDYAQHGDYGIGGARGNARGLAATTYKMVIGHSHGARIVRGVYQVGSSTIVLEYERGYGSRSNTHCIQYANGKRTLVDIFKGRWHL